LQNPTLPRTASADWKQAVSSATASDRKICQNHFFKIQFSSAEKLEKTEVFPVLCDICGIIEKKFQKNQICICKISKPGLYY